VFDGKKVRHVSSFNGLTLCLTLKADLAQSEILCSKDRMWIEFSFLCTLRICCYAVRHYVNWCVIKELRDVFGNFFTAPEMLSKSLSVTLPSFCVMVLETDLCRRLRLPAVST